MLDQNQSLPSNSELQLIYRNMLIHATRQVPNLDSAFLLQKHKLFEEAQAQLNKQTAIIRNIGTQISSLLLEFMNYRETMEQTVDDLNEQIEEKTIDMQNLQEAVTHLEKKVLIYQEQYGKLKNVSELLADNGNANELNWSQQKQKLHDEIAFLKEKITVHANKASELTNEKDLLLSQLVQQRARSEQISQQLKDLKVSLKCKDELISKKDTAIAQLTKEKQKIEASYQFCSKALKNCQEEMKQDDSLGSLEKAISDKPAKRSCRYQSFHKAPQYEQERQNMADKLPFTPFYEFSWSYLRCGYKKTERMQSDLECLSLDPYFAHFVLTSQSVKIRQDCEELLNIDVKPYYHEIVERRVPMHMWDQWIRNKLRELHRRCRKPSGGLTSQQEIC